MVRFTKVQEREIRDLLSELERSGQSVREFAREAGLSVWTIYGWRKRFHHTSGVEDGARADLVEVQPTVPLGATIEIAFADASIRVSPGFVEDDLRRVIQVMRSC
ncbi:MAG: helix-turn-helix domain-containing protein [Planctomycetota bacterium]